ncbi:hypothetical protein H4R19_002850 [Coemansia spiralis]|nr:hypothetical protein H4R19_002850 [Coemansia spiralis]
MLLPGVRVYAPRDVILHGAPAESAGYVLDGRVMVTVPVAVRIRELTVAFRASQSSRWTRLLHPAHTQRSSAADDDYGGDEHIELRHQLCGDDSGGEVLARGRHEFLFRVELPGDLAETMFTAHKRVAYEVRADLVLGGALGGVLGGGRRWAAQAVAVKRVPFFGPAWEFLASDMIHVSAVWRNRIEMCALGCSRVQRDGRPLRVKGVVRALEKGFRLTRIGFLLEERTRSRMGPAPATSSSAIAASRYLRAGEHGGWCGSPIIDQMAFDVELQIPKAYGKIQYDVKHGPVTVSHRLAFVVAVVDRLGRGTSLRLFTPLHIMPHDCAGSGDELPAYAAALADRVLLAAAVAESPTR